LFDEAITFKKKHRVLSHIIFWLAVLMIYVSNDKYRDRDEFSLGLTKTEVSMFASIQILASYFLTYFIVPEFFYKKKYLRASIYFIIGTYVFCASSRYLTIHVGEPIAGVAKKEWETDYEIFTNLWKLIYVYFFQIFTVAFVFLFFKLLLDQSETQKKALSLEKAKAETELKLLKTQLNPHFLFNTLNNIYSLSVHNSPATSEAIARLSDILDHMLYRCNGLYVPLSTEINLLKNYIELEKLRYDERLLVNFTTEIERDVDIAPLIVLSIVENAFKHGAGQDIGNPIIDIQLRVTDNTIKCWVANTFAGNGTIEGNEKIGLHNLRQQLDLLYPGTHTLEIAQTANLFTVILIIKLQPEKQFA